MPRTEAMIVSMSSGSIVRRSITSTSMPLAARVSAASSVCSRLREYETMAAVAAGLEAYFWFYCHERPHQALGNRTPAAVYALAANATAASEPITMAPKSQHLAGSSAQQNGAST